MNLYNPVVDLRMLHKFKGGTTGFRVEKHKKQKCGFLFLDTGFVAW